ncbi:MAG TPA: lipopolysaccharide kinase InaA family protein [Thermodesulfobacteriota bacterium]|nr:lipopolysaccharide kinase InaA family protein [Thermodesulfobacteriota bacterium]
MEAKSNILKKEDLSCLLNPETLAGFNPLKEETNTRLILKGRWDNSSEPLVIKIFKRPYFFDQVKYLFRPPRSRKEWQIAQKLSAMGIATPLPVAYVALRSWRFLRKDIIVFREISDGEPLIHWTESNIIKKAIPFTERKEVIRTLGHFVRRIHDQGIFSKDFHQGNILVKTEPAKPPLFYLVDLHSIQIKKEITRRERIKMLAQFNNFRIPIADRLRFLNAYLQGEEQEEILKKALVKEIGLASFKHWQRLWQKRKKRALRPGKGLKAFEVGPWKGMIRKEEKYYLKNIFPLLYRRSANMKVTDDVVEEVSLQQEKANDLVIRYYCRNSLLSSLRSFFQISPAKKTWITMHNLIMRGIPTLVPVAFGERKRWGILRDCFFVFKKTLEATSGAIFLKKLFEAPLSTPAKAGIQNQSKLLDSHLRGSDKLGIIRSALIFQFARLIQRMHQTGICYPTLKPTDVSITFDHKEVLLQVMNGDGITIKKNVGINDVAKDLRNIDLSFFNVLEQKDQSFFFKIYAWGNTFFKDHGEKIRDKMQKLSAKRSA